MKKLILVYGGIGCGKTTFSNILSDRLKRGGLNVKILHAFQDIYKPYLESIEKGNKTKKNRKDINQDIENIYSKKGEIFGTQLLLDAIKKIEEDYIIIDGKRNKSGIKLLKETLGSRCIMIGIKTDRSTRISRIKLRHRTEDLYADISNMIDAEEKKYKISSIYALCDFILNNNKSRNEIELFIESLLNTIILDSKEHENVAVLYRTLCTYSESQINKEWFDYFCEKYQDSIKYSKNIKFEKTQEIEIKSILTDDIHKNLKTFLDKIETKIPAPHLEDDIVLDTLFDDLKNHGIVFRIRKKNNLLLFTLKIRQISNDVKFDFEIEDDFSNTQTQELVNDFLTTCKLPKFNFGKAEELISKNNELDEFIKNLNYFGYEKIRMRMQKKRSEITIKNLCTICIDSLPYSREKFLEIETHTYKSIEKIKKILQLPVLLPPSMDYGELAKKINSERGFKNTRSLTFDTKGYTINAPARIHMCLIDCGNGTSRLFGGLGFGINGLFCKIEGNQSKDGWKINFNNFHVDERTRNQIKDIFEKIQNAYPSMKPIAYSIQEMPPQHCGLGSKTSLLLSVVKLAFIINDIPVTPEEIVYFSGRGGTSGIGINTFFSGGIITDSGHDEDSPRNFAPSSSRSQNEKKPKIISKITSSKMKVMILADIHSQHSGVHGEEELKIFKNSMPIPNEQIFITLAAVYHGIIPAFQEGNRMRLHESIKILHQNNLKKIEFSLQSQKTKDFMEILWSKKYPAGISSFGPSIYVLGTEQELSKIDSLVIDHGLKNLGIFEIDTYGAQITKNYN